MDCVEKTYLNEMDQRLVAKLSPRKYVKPLRQTERTLHLAVLMFSDQQVVTGIGLLASADAQLNRGIQTYHWQMLVYLVWFSSLTHLTILTVITATLSQQPCCLSLESYSYACHGSHARCRPFADRR